MQDMMPQPQDTEKCQAVDVSTIDGLRLSSTIGFAISEIVDRIDREDEVQEKGVVLSSQAEWHCLAKNSIHS